jgi:hypothetical protein
MSHKDLLAQMLFFDLCDDNDEQAWHSESEWECSECGNNLLLNDNYKVCSRCGACFELGLNNEVLVCRGTFKKSIYKQLNHFKHILSTLQNQERRTVPHDVLDRLEEHLENLEVTLDNIRKTLKIMGESKYYKHAVQLWCYLQGVTVFDCLKPDEYDRVLLLFERVQRAFRELKNHRRINFLNYNYVASKLLLKIGRPDLSQLCKPLKHSALRNHNKLWVRLCEIDGTLL